MRTKPIYKRRTNGTFAKGSCPNPTGRPKGARGKLPLFREALQARHGEIVQAIIDKALNGDSIAQRLCAERLAPSLKAVSEPVSMTLPEEPNEAAKQIINKVSGGSLSIEAGLGLLRCLIDSQTVHEMTELKRQVQALTEHVQRQRQKRGH